MGRISFEGNEAKAINARNAVPPAWPTVAYSRDTAPISADMISAIAILPDEVRGRIEKTAKCKGDFAASDRLRRATVRSGWPGSKNASGNLSERDKGTRCWGRRCVCYKRFPRRK